MAKEKRNWKNYQQLAHFLFCYCFLLLPHCVIFFAFSAFHFRCQCASLFIIPSQLSQVDAPSPSTGFKAFDILSNWVFPRRISIWCAPIKMASSFYNSPPPARFFINIHIFSNVFSFCFISISFDFVWLFKWKIVTIIFELIE